MQASILAIVSFDGGISYLPVTRWFVAHRVGFIRRLFAVLGSGLSGWNTLSHGKAKNSL